MPEGSILASRPDVRVVLVQSAADVWMSASEKDFESGSEIVYRRARLFVKAEIGFGGEEITWSFRMDRQIVAELGYDAVALELANQMVLAFRELPGARP